MRLNTDLETLWLIIGFLGQGLFFMRFFIQWLASERKKQSVIPLAFWYFSVGGGLVLLLYAIYRKDPVFAIGQAGGLLIYARNLYLIFKERSARNHASNTLELD